MKLIFKILFLLLLTSPSGHAQSDSATSRRVDGVNQAAASSLIVNQVDTSKFPEVTLFVTVLRGDEPVSGLTASDFRVREDEVDQEPLNVTPKLDPLKAVVTIDTSGSIKKALPAVQTAAGNFLDVLDAQDTFTVVSFAREVKVLNNSGSREEAKKAISSTVARGDTALYDALFESVNNLKEVPGRKAVILLSDGVDDDGTGKQLSKHSLDEGLELSRKVNAPVYVLGLGSEKDPAILQKIATETGGKYYDAPQASDLQAIYASIGKQLRGQYAIQYTSNLPADGSTHRIKVEHPAEKIFGLKEYIAPESAAGKVADSASQSELPSAPAARPTTTNASAVVEVHEAKVPPGLHVHAVLAPGGERVIVDKFQLFPVQDDFSPNPGAAKEIAHSDYNVDKWTFKVPAGSYEVRVKKGELLVAKTVEVSDKQGVQQEIVLNAGVLHVVSKMTKDAQRLKVDRFDVALAGDEFNKDKTFDSAYSTELWTVHVPAGRLVVSAKRGIATVRKELDVKPGDVLKEALIFDGGQVTLVAAMTADGQPVKVDRFDLLATDDLLEPKVLETGYSLDNWTITANQGNYIIRATLDEAKAEKKITLKPGESLKEKLILNAGVLEIIATKEGQSQPLKVKKFFVRTEAVEGGQQTTLSEAYSTTSLVTVLPEGRYVAGVEFEGGSNQVPVEIKAGSRFRQEMKVVKQAE